MPRLSDIEVALTAEDRTSAAINSAKRGLTSFGEAAGALAGSVALVGGALLAATKTAIDYASGIVDAAEQTGLGVEQFQALRYAAGQAGVGAEEFTAAMSRFNTTIGAAANGSKAQTELFARMGIAIRDTSGNVRSSEAILGDFANAIEAIDNPAQQARAAAEAFGRSAGPKMAVLLREGSGGLRQLQDEARSVGAVLSEDVARRAEGAGDKLETMSNIVKIQVTDALVTLTPLITAAGNAFALAAPKIAKFYEEIEQLPISVASAKLQGYEDRVQSLQDKLAGRNWLGEIIGAPAPGSVAERTMKEDLARERIGLERQRRELQRLLAERETRRQGPAAAAVITPSAGDVDRTAAQLAAEKAAEAERKRLARERAAAEKAALREVSDFEGAEQLRSQMATEQYYAELAQRREEYVAAGLEQFRQSGEAAIDEAGSMALANAMASLDGFQAIEDRGMQAAENVADSFERILFAGFRDGTDGMLDAFKAVLVQMGTELLRSQLREGLASIFSDALGNNSKGSGGGWTSAILNVLGSVSGGKSGSIGTLKGAAMGGSFIVPGSASGDNVVPLFRANAGEKVTITPPGGGGAAAEKGGVTIVQNISAPGANQETVAAIRREAAAAARAAVGEVINLRSRGRL